MTDARTRLRLLVMGLGVLLVAGGLAFRETLVNVARRTLGSGQSAGAPGGDTASAGESLSRTPVSTASAASAVSSGLLDRLLAGQLNCGKITLESGIRARIERLQIPFGKRADQMILIPSARLELDVKSMSLRGEMDGAAAARDLLQRRMPFFGLPPAAKLPFKIVVPASGAADYRTWNMSAELAGQKLLFLPAPALAAIPLAVTNGRLGFENGRFAMDGLEIAVGNSRLALAGSVSDPLGMSAFDRTQLSGSLDLMDLLVDRSGSGQAVGGGKLDLNMAVSGPTGRPEITGTLKGAMEIPSLPLPDKIAGLSDRRVTLNLPRLEGRVTSREAGTLVAAEIASTGGLIAFSSPTRLIGFRGGRATARAALAGSWLAPRLEHAVELLDGVFEYRQLDRALAGSRFELPYRSVKLSAEAIGPVRIYNFDAKLPGGGLARADVQIDSKRQPASTSYSVHTTSVDLSALTATLFEGKLRLNGILNLDAQGKAGRMAFVDMQGTGTGELKDFSVDWSAPEDSLADQDIADLLRRAVFPKATVSLPAFGKYLVLDIGGATTGVRVAVRLKLDPNLGAQGTFEYIFDPAWLATAPAAEAAMMRRGANGRLSLKVSGPPGRLAVNAVVP